MTTTVQPSSITVTKPLITAAQNGPAPNANLLRAQTNTVYDNQGRVYQSSTYSVDTSGNLSAVPLVTNNWYNHRGELVKTSAPGGLVQKMTYDGAGRESFVYTTDGNGDSTWADAQHVAGSQNNVLTQTQTQYDGDNNPVFMTTWDRYHNSPYQGDLSQAATQQARVSFDGKFYDTADRLTNEVNYGNNHNNPLSSRPTSPAARGADPMNPVLRTDYAYAADTVQTVALSGTPTGNFTLSFGGQTTVAIDVMATAATVQMDLQNLNPAIGANNVLVYGPAGGPWNVRFTGKFAGQDEPLLTATGSGLMNGSVSVARASQGGDAGRVQTVTDPRGLATQTDYDLLGRTLRTVAAFTNQPVFSNPNWNQVTEYAYDGDDHVVLLTAYPGNGTLQQTQYSYAANAPDSSWVNSKDQLILVQYPDKTSGRPSTLPADQDSYLYNNLGETRSKTERTGT